MGGLPIPASAAGGGSLGQIAAIALGALAGLALSRSAGAPASALGHLNFPVSRRGGAVALGLFAALFTSRGSRLVRRKTWLRS
jgi:hypothetical protein